MAHYAANSAFIVNILRRCCYYMPTAHCNKSCDYANLSEKLSLRRCSVRLLHICSTESLDELLVLLR